MQGRGVALIVSLDIRLSKNIFRPYFEKKDPASGAKVREGKYYPMPRLDIAALAILSNVLISSAGAVDGLLDGVEPSDPV